MSARRVIVALVTAAALGPALNGPHAPAAGSGGSGGGGSNSIGAWVIGAGPGGGVSAPPGTSCGGWDHAANLSPNSGPIDVDTVRLDENGRIWNLYYRICGELIQFVWVPQLTPEELGTIAFDEVLRLLPRPAPVLSPSVATGGYVNFESWLAVNDPGIVTATAAIPGLSATATAGVVQVEWTPGDGAPAVECEPFGALPPSADALGPAPCGHTWRAPSSPKAGGTGDQQFMGMVALVWDASWTASNGASGSLGQARSEIALPYVVREIQTIGVEG